MLARGRAFVLGAVDAAVPQLGKPARAEPNMTDSIVYNGDANLVHLS
ncbi:hypothetical protein [Amycolatopsis sp. NPDC051716]